MHGRIEITGGSNMEVTGDYNANELTVTFAALKAAATVVETDATMDIDGGAVGYTGSTKAACECAYVQNTVAGALVNSDGCEMRPGSTIASTATDARRRRLTASATQITFVLSVAATVARDLDAEALVTAAFDNFIAAVNSGDFESAVATASGNTITVAVDTSTTAAAAQSSKSDTLAAAPWGGGGGGGSGGGGGGSGDGGGSSGLSMGVIVGIAVAGGVGLVITAGLTWWLMHRKGAVKTMPAA